MFNISIKEIKKLEQIKIPDQFGIQNNLNRDDVIKELNKIFKPVLNNFYITFGATKTVLINDTNSYVIKIPFNGEWQTSNIFINFVGANDTTNQKAAKWDYCSNEYIKYQKAITNGFENFFPETKLLTYAGRFPIYIQEQAEVFWDHADLSYISKNNLKRYEKSSTCKQSFLNKDWVLAAINYYGLEETEEFIRYAEDHDLLDDMHEDNLGFCECFPVFLDWAGYHT